jgi:hypothetical protein
MKQLRGLYAQTFFTFRTTLVLTVQELQNTTLECPKTAIQIFVKPHQLLKFKIRATDIMRA